MTADPALLRSARHIAKDIFARVIQPGDTVVDATLGTGQDCLTLCQLVGEKGLVHGFDVQPQALERTRERLTESGLHDRAQLHLLGHERMAEVVPQGVKLIAFNLGWLPGSDKRVTTQVETTLKAVQAALSLLIQYGVLVVCVYPGHEEGQREQEALLSYAASLNPRHVSVLWHDFLNAGIGAPGCLVIEKIREEVLQSL